MERQAFLPFGSRYRVTPQAADYGLTLVGGFCMGLGLPEWADRYMPGPGSGAGFKPGEYILPLILMLIGGGRSLEDIRLIREDQILRETLRMARVPSPDAIGGWLRRMSARDGMAGLERINRKLVQRVLAHKGLAEDTVDICFMTIAAEKASAKLTRSGHRGYLPMVGILQQERLAIQDAFREGDAARADGLPEFIRDCVRQMAGSHGIKRIRVGPVPWQDELFRVGLQAKVDLIVAVMPDASILRAIRAMPASEWSAFREGQLARLAYVKTASQAQAQLVIWRRPYQASLFAEPDDGPRYLIIASNRTIEAETIIAHYHEHLQFSRGHIESLETEFGLGRMPCGQTGANAVFFRIGTIAHNINRLFSSRVSAAPVKTGFTTF
jgi:hypothetical protein